jgi:hypothetical protein
VIQVAPDSLEVVSVELYDLASDPGERHDLSAERPERASELAEEVLKRLRSLGSAARVNVEAPMPGAELKLLEVLGYTDVNQEE